MYSFSFLQNAIQKYFNATQSESNMITGFYTGFLFCSGPIVSGLIIQFGIRPVVIVGTVICSITFMIASYAQSIHIIIGIYGVIGGILIIKNDKKSS
jgi:fucose permease